MFALLALFSIFLAKLVYVEIADASLNNRNGLLNELEYNGAKNLLVNSSTFELSKMNPDNEIENLEYFELNKTNYVIQALLSTTKRISSGISPTYLKKSIKTVNNIEITSSSIIKAQPSCLTHKAIFPPKHISHRITTTYVQRNIKTVNNIEVPSASIIKN